VPPQDLIQRYLLDRPAEIPVSAAYILNDLPRNYSKTGTVDYTVWVQKSINDNRTVVFPDFPLLVNAAGLKVPSDRVLIFQEKSLLQFAGPAKAKYADILKIYNAENVRIVNPRIKGSKHAQNGQQGEWSAGISILNSKNITVENPYIYDTYGDGIFIGSEDGGFSEQIHITHGWINNARRNGISITSARNVYISNLLVSNTNGTLPECGIDIEPSWNKDVLENVNLNNVYTYNNKIGGIAINLNGLSEDSAQKVKTVSININKHTDNGSAYALTTSLNVIKGKYDVKGTINITDSYWQNNRTDVYWKSETEQKTMLTFKNIKIDDFSKMRKFKAALKNKKNVKVIN
jgi:hypothetical protein